MPRFTMGPEHVCPIRNCKALVSSTKLLCSSHWRMVPGVLGDELYAAWREVRRYRRLNLEPSPTAKARAILRHRTAMKACIAAVHSQVVPPATLPM